MMQRPLLARPAILTVCALALLGVSCKGDPKAARLDHITESPLVLAPGETATLTAGYTVINDEGFEVAAHSGTWTLSDEAIAAGAILDGGTDPVEGVAQLTAPYRTGSWTVSSSRDDDPDSPHVVEVQIVAPDAYAEQTLWRTGRSLESSLGAAQWSPDGSAILLRTRYATTVLEADTLRQRFHPRVGGSGATFTAEGDVLVGGAVLQQPGEGVTLYDGQTAERLMVMPYHSEHHVLVAHHDGSSWLETGEVPGDPLAFTRARTVEATSGRFVDEITPFPFHTAAWSPDGRFLAAGGRGTSAVLETQTWGIFLQPDIDVLELQWSADGAELLVLGQNERHVDRIDLITGEATWQAHPALDSMLAAHPPQSMAATADLGTIWLALRDGTLRRYDDGEVSWDVSLGISEPKGLALSPDESELAIELDQRLVILDASDGSVKRRAPQVRDTRDVQRSPDGSAVAVADTRSLTVYEVADGAIRWTVARAGNQLRRLRWSPDGSRLASAQDGTVTLYAASDGSVTDSHSLDGWGDELLWTRHGLLFPGDWEGSYLVDPDTWAVLGRVPCATQLASAGDDAVFGRNTEYLGPDLLLCPLPGEGYTSVSPQDLGNRWLPSPDSSRLIVSRLGGSIEVWDTLTGHEISTLDVASELTAVGWTADSAYVLTAWDFDPDQSGPRHLLRWWDPATGAEVARQEAASDPNRVNRVVGLLDGTVITGGDELIRWESGP